MAWGLDGGSNFAAHNPLGWSPRPGLDLDAGIRVGRFGPLSEWPVIIPQKNQYDSFLGGMGIACFSNTLDHRVYAIADQNSNPAGPHYGVQPTNEEARWPWDIINGLVKQQFEEYRNG